jgi:hypothetical protein
MSKEPEPRLVDYSKGRRQDVEWVWQEGPVQRTWLLEKLKDAKSEKKKQSTD